MEGTEKKSITLQGVPLDAVFTLPVSGGFYSRLHSLLIFLSKQKSLEEFTLALQSLKTGQPKNDYEEQLLTVFVLIKGCEDAAKAQDKIRSADIFPEEHPKVA